MNESPDIEVIVRQVSEKDGRFAPGAYHFLLEALEYTMRLHGREKKEGPERHVGGVELLEGIRRFALHQFGPLAPVVFEHWGVRRTEDFGAMVFRLVDAGHLSRQDSDSMHDFADGYDFQDAFVKNYKIEIPEQRF
ncbi:MAG: hypothetical protein HY286_04205 [Planctomycetes bacterium]|nr:hypothetical protein [Planctomycetota bacterium]